MRPRWWWYAPVALLIAVALRQIVLTHIANLAPWSGGGFGMFASVDGWGNRHVAAFAIRSDVRRELEIPPPLREATRRLRAYPSEANAQALATALADQPTPDEGPLEAIEIQVWSTTYDPVTTAPSEGMLRSFRIPRVDP
ncbi:MAG: hypothetical protein ABIR79_13400 [Candidatus Binatia bacterium]